MIIKERFIKALVATASAIILIIPFMVADRIALGAAATKNLDAGSTWLVNETTNLTSLTIAKGAAIKAPEGYSVTMSVDGIGTAIKPGDYKGKIMLTVTKEIKMGGTSGGGGGMPGSGAPGGGAAGGGIGDMPGAGDITRVNPGPFKAAIYVENGKYIAEKSVAAVVTGGKVSDNSANDVKITSNEPDFNGIIVTGDSKSSYTFNNHP